MSVKLNSHNTVYHRSSHRVRNRHLVPRDFGPSSVRVGCALALRCVWPPRTTTSPCQRNFCHTDGCPSDMTYHSYLSRLHFQSQNLRVSRPVSPRCRIFLTSSLRRTSKIQRLQFHISVKLDRSNRPICELWFDIRKYLAQSSSTQ